MQVIDRGAGVPLVLIPGLPGRWEYLTPAVDALANHFRVLTFDLCDERGADAPFDPDHVIDSFANQVEQLLDSRGIERAVICGISFGGIIALRTAARIPSRVSALVLASTPGPMWHLKRRHRLYTRLPWLFGPVFALESPWRLLPEINASLPTAEERRKFRRQLRRTLVQAPVSLSRMAVRARAIESHDKRSDCKAVSCRTLVVHGEPSLDHVVNPAGTSEYERVIHGAQRVLLANTGHLGCITRPEEFAAIVHRFISSVNQDSRHSAA